MAVASVQRGRGGASARRRRHRRVAKRGTVARCSGRRGRAAVLAHGSRLLRWWGHRRRAEGSVCGAGRGVPYAGPWGGRERLTHLPGVGAGGSRQPRRRLSTPLPAAAPPPPARCGRSSACCPRLCGAACLCLGDAGLRALSPQNTEVVAQAKPDRFPRLYVLPHMPSFSIRKFMVQGEPKALSYLVESSGCLAG